MAKAIAMTTDKPTGPVGRFVHYIHDVRLELGKVTWPTLEELKASTTVVLFFLVILAVMTGVMDAVFQRAVLLLFKLT